MEVHITPETEAKLDDLARPTHKGRTQLLGEAVDQLYAYNDWFERKVGDSRAAVEGGGTVPDTEVAAWLERRERRSQQG
jgi:predicted transcriptional regulator